MEANAPIESEPEPTEPQAPPPVVEPPAEPPPAEPTEPAAPTPVDPRATGMEYRKTATVWAVQMSCAFEVPTLEGTMSGQAGDYLCQGPAGERWPVKREIFEATYAPAAPTPVDPEC